MKTILMIAFHYPPYQGGSGIHRTVKFAQYLGDHGWQPIVLSANPRAYPETEFEQTRLRANGVRVARAFALDTARHLSIHGSYLRWMALPDRWISWLLGAVPAGLRLVRKYRPEVIWSTYPIATAHLIGLVLHRMSGVPWVADFRDSMTEEGYPSHPRTRRVYRWIERETVKDCTRAVFTTPGTAAMYAERYPEVPRSRWSIIANGYDEEDFAAVEQSLRDQCSSNHRAVLVHSGVLYPSERDPRAFFAALADLRRKNKISPSNIRVVLRGSGSEVFYREQLRKHGIEDIVALEASIPYRAALTEMLHSDGLLLFQAANCNHQIPAKIYEYLRARRPIFAMTDSTGDTAELLRSAGVGSIAALDQKDEIANALEKFLENIHEQNVVPIEEHEIYRYTRKARTQELAALLESITL
jgi:glycosyltransferase involved in cell wall biosynthesis